MERQNEQKEMLLYASSNQTQMFPVMWSVCLLKLHMDSKSNWAKEGKKDPVSPMGCKAPRRWLRLLCGTHKGWGGWRGGMGRLYSVDCTPGKIAAVGGSLDGPLMTPPPAVLMVLRQER